MYYQIDFLLTIKKFIIFGAIVQRILNGALTIQPIETQFHLFQVCLAYCTLEEYSFALQSSFGEKIKLQ